jgi:hypothetical protein
MFFVPGKNCRRVKPAKGKGLAHVRKSETQTPRSVLEGRKGIYPSPLPSLCRDSCSVKN